MESKLLFFLLFILGFIFLPVGVSWFENPKVLLGELGIFLLIVSAIWKNQFPTLNKDFQLGLLVGVAILLIIQMIWLRDEVQMFGNIFRLQGMFIVCLLVIFAYISKQVNFEVKPKVIVGLLIVNLLITLFLPQNISYRYVGTLGEPNASAAFVVFLWTWVISLKINGKVKAVATMLSAVSVWWMFQSRSAVIALVVVGVIWGLMRLGIGFKKVAIMGILLCLFSFRLPYLEQKSVYENRAEIWNVAAYAGWKNPVIGGGFGNTENLLHEAAVELKLPLQYVYVDSSHNIWLDWWVQSGAVGLSLLIGLVILTLKRIVENENRLKLMLMLGLMTTLSFNPASVVGLIQLWWMIGEEKQNS